MTLRRLWHWLFGHPCVGIEPGTNPYAEGSGFYGCRCGKKVSYVGRRKA